MNDRVGPKGISDNTYPASLNQKTDPDYAGPIFNQDTESPDAHKKVTKRAPVNNRVGPKGISDNAYPASLNQKTDPDYAGPIFN